MQVSVSLRAGRLTGEVIVVQASSNETPDDVRQHRR